MRFAIFTLLVLAWAPALHSQQPVSITDTIVSGKSPENARNVQEIFRHGRFHGHFRSFFMATDNASGLTDYYGLAAGGGLYFNTAVFHGFQMGIGGVFHYNVASSDLTRKDPLTGTVNRYEIGLFDVENPNNRTDIDRLEDFWLRYERKGIRITLGQQALQTPFINYQDGRMRPTMEAGLWLESEAVKNTRIEGGWLWGISPRSTVKWYRIGESIGLYPKGLNPDGTASGYPENLKSRGVGLLGLTHRFGKNTRVQAWDQYVDNIFNTLFLQADYTHPLHKGHKILLGFQAIHQDALSAGGNEDPTKTYFPRGAQSNAFSVQAGWQRNAWQVLAAYTHITGDGRFLSPREWGREPFYTFMARERIEGSGDSHAVTGRVRWQPNGKNWQLEVAYGHFYLPDVKNASLNKYAFPSYNQFNFDVRYTFKGALEGLKTQFLFVYKGRLGDIYGNRKYEINRVNMGQYNLVLNYVY